MRIITQKIFKSWIALLLLVSFQAFAQPTVLGTQVVNGTYTTYNLNTVGGFKQIRLQATSAAATGLRNWEFAKGTAASTDYSTTWRPYTSGNTMTLNAFIPTSFANGAKFNNPGGQSGLLPAIVMNTYYTFNVSNLNADNVMSVLATTYNPVTVSSVTGNANYVSITTSGTPNSTERIFVRYSSDSYVTSAIVEATGSGTNWTALLPASGTHSYYVYTSSRTKAAIDGDVTTYGQGVHDMSTLNLSNNGGTNYTYTANNIASNPITGTSINSATPYTTGQVTNVNVTSTGISKGSGITAITGTDRYSGSGFNVASLDANKYYEFSISANSGYRINFDTYNYTIQTSGTGPTTFSLRSSVDSYGSSIGSVTNTAGNTITGSVSLAAASYQAVTGTITFRLYAWGASGTGGTFSVNDYSFNGVVELIPSAPEMNIKGNTATITDGDTTPALADHTDFGSVLTTSGFVTRTFTIENTGTVTLNLGSNAVSLSATNGFSITSQPATTVAAASFTTFQITFDPSLVGAETITINVASDDSDENPYNFDITGTGTTPAPEMNIQGNSVTIVDGDITPSATDDTNFGSISTVAASVTKTFTIQNTGTGTLTLGTDAVSLSSTVGFSITAQPATTVAAAGFTTFQITFDPSVGGAEIITVNVASDDADENPYNFNVTGTGIVPVAEINIQGNTVSIVDGDTTPSATDHSDFGSVSTVGASVVRTFTIQNTGAATLNLGTNAVSLSSTVGFSITSQPATTVAPAGSTTFQVTFDPSVGGAETITVNVANDDADENPYNFNVTGTGVVPVAEINVVGNAVSIVDGDITPSLTDHTDFGSVSTTTGSVVRTFTIQNTGTATLNLGTNAASLSATNGFSILTQPATTVAAGGSTTVQVTFDPSVAGPETVTLNIANDDSNENPYNFNVTGNGTPANDDCANGVGLTVGNAPITGNTLGATQTIAGCVGNANDDIWYTFTTGAAGTYTITVVGSASFDAVVGVRSGVCNGTSIFCIDANGAGGTETVSATGLSAATTYLIRVYDYAAGTAATTTFTIAIAPPPATLLVNGAASASLSFANTNVLANSSSQFFNLSGNNLTGFPSNITVTAPANFEVSNDDTTWGGTTSVAYTSATLSSTPVYVRFVPQSSGAKTGNITFSGGGVLTPPTVAVSGTGVIPAPTALPATNIQPTQFNANWNAVSGATSYLLDVSTSSTFGTSAPATVTESFETGLTASYQTGNVTLGTGVWAVTNVLKGTGGVNTGTGSAQLQSATGSALVSPSFANISSISFYVTSSTAAGAIQVNYSTDGGTNWLAAPGSPFTGLGTTKVQKNITLNLTAPDVKIQILRTGATISIDDVVFNYTGTTPSFVTGYNGFNVGNVTSYQVTGLAPETQYHYRVRAVSGGASANSNVISVTTKPTAVTWNGTAWSNVTGPDADIEAIIAGIYNTSANGTFTAKKVTVNSGSLTVASGTDLTIQNELVNNMTSADVVVENNGNLLQVNDVDNTGDILVKRNSSALRRLDYTLWSSPVDDQNLSAFSPMTTANRFYTYSTASNLYSSVDPLTTSFDPGKGYLIRMPNDHPSITATIWNGEFTGTPNNGDVTFTLLNFGSDNRFNLVGNPYASPISISTFVAENTANITGELYFWRKNNASASGAYVTYVAGTYTGNDDFDAAALNAPGHEDVIQTGQGFIVKANDTAPGTELVFTNEMRVGNNANEFFRSSNETSIAEKSRIWISATSAEGANSQMAVVYVDGAVTEAIDMFDGRYMNDGDLSLNSLIASEEFVIQGRAPFVPSDVVPLSFTTDVAGTYNIAIDHLDGLFAGDQNIYLKDNVLGATHDLKASAYEFTSDAGTFATRFEVVYEQPLAVGNPSFDENTVQVYTSNGDVVVNSGNVLMSGVKIYDIRGRLIAERSAVNASELTLNAGSANQVLIVKITSTDNAVVTRKVLR